MYVHITPHFFSTISADATNTNVTAQPEQKNESSEKGNYVERI